MTAEKSVDREEAIQFIRLIKQLNEAQQAGLRLTIEGLRLMSAKK